MRSSFCSVETGSITYPTLKEGKGLSSPIPLTMTTETYTLGAYSGRMGSENCSLLLSSCRSLYSRMVPRSMVSRAVVAPAYGEGMRIWAVSPGRYDFSSAIRSMRSLFLWPQLMKRRPLIHRYVALRTSFPRSSSPLARTL